VVSAWLALVAHSCVLPSVELVDSFDGDCTPACASGQSCFGDQCCTTPPAGGSCSLDGCGCDPGDICYPDTKQTGLGCFASDGLTLGQACDPEMCATGYGCYGSVCKKYCTTAADCPSIGGVRDCLQATWSEDSSPIAGVKACAYICDPANPSNPRSPLQACPSGYRCDPDTSSSTAGISHCGLSTGTQTAGETCTYSDDCIAGYGCSSGLCVHFCSRDADCPSGKSCSMFSTAIYAGGYQLGACQT